MEGKRIQRPLEFSATAVGKVRDLCQVGRVRRRAKGNPGSESGGGTVINIRVAEEKNPMPSRLMMGYGADSVFMQRVRLGRHFAVRDLNGILMLIPEFGYRCARRSVRMGIVVIQFVTEAP